MKSPYENGSNSTRKIQNKSKMKKNITRMGGGGLSLETFANLKSKNNAYNPAIIKKQREFYKAAKCVNKYKKTLKQLRPGDISFNSISQQEDNIEKGETSAGNDMNRKSSKNKKTSAYSLKQLYEEKHKEQENARKEREALFQEKKEAREKAESKRKDAKKKMYKKTKSGQPVMKYRIEHLLETIKASANE